MTITTICQRLTVASVAIGSTLLIPGIVGKAEANNLVFNGDFSAGNTGFSSNYSSHNTHDLAPTPARYAIGSNPRAHHVAFGSFGDHTSGDGLMMIVNGGSYSEGAGPLVWSQTINNLVPNTEYDLSAWVATTVAAVPAQLQFAINSQVIGPVLAASMNPNGLWENLNANWNSGTNSSVEFSIINHNQFWSGNDFALDDISFTPVATTPEPKPVPEPSSVLGLFAFGAVGAGSLLKRKLQKKASLRA